MRDDPECLEVQTCEPNYIHNSDILPTCIVTCNIFEYLLET